MATIIKDLINDTLSSSNCSGKGIKPSFQQPIKIISTRIGNSNIAEETELVACLAYNAKEGTCIRSERECCMFPFVTNIETSLVRYYTKGNWPTDTS